MHLDVRDLRNFYYRQALGRATQRAIRTQVQHLWPDVTGQTVVGFGFAAPLLRPFLPDARRVVALMPGPQGVMAWPAGQPNVSVLTNERMWPLETGRVDKLVMLHGLETSDDVSAMLSEAERVLGPGGRALFIVPNRAGLWSRNDATPFGFGRPYTTGQLDAQLKGHGFTPIRHSTALYFPPTHSRVWRRFSPLIERLGQKLPVLTGGVVLVEAGKSALRPPGQKVTPPHKRALGILEGLTNVGPKPAILREIDTFQK